MPRRCRIYQVQKALVFHVVNRGILKQTIFHDEQDVRQFIDLVSRFGRKEAAKVYHWCLMHNHYHLLLEMADPRRLSKMVGGCQQVYALKYHRRYNTAGRLFQNRFKCQAVDEESYLMACGRYIEQNPVRAGLCAHAWQWTWSSAGFYVKGAADSLTTFDPQWADRSREEYGLWLEERSGEQEALFRSSRNAIGGVDVQRCLLKEGGRLVQKRRGRRRKW